MNVLRPNRRTLGLAAAALAVAGPGLTQTPIPDLPTQLFRDNRYLPIWRAVRDRPEDETLAQMAAFVGEERVALAGAGRRPGDLPLPTDAVAEDAVAAIVAAAKGRRVVILNEAHVASRHRQFLAQLLRALRPEGFSVLAAEDFLNLRDPGTPDIRVFRAGAPLDTALGYYLHDPVYAEAVREAAALGYRFAPYEQRRDQRVAGEPQAAAMARRDTAEADNFIADILSPDPQARVLVHCGYGHLRKRSDAKGNEWFAQRLAAKTGLDPLCVSQAYTGSFGPQAGDRPLTRQVLERFSPRRSIVVRTAVGVVGAEEMAADLAVFHPVIPDVDGRPGWLAADPMRRRVAVEVPPRSEPAAVIVQAIHAVEPERAIPADQQVLAVGETRATLFLRPGSYRLRLETEAGFTPLKTLEV